MKPSELPAVIAIHTLQCLRQQAPLVHCLTNEVVQTITANTLLALGAAPAMIVEPEEAAQFSAIADALLINIGTLCHQRATAMLEAIAAARVAETPWVLDPVGVGALHYRSNFARLLLTMNPAAVRGNASEILALAGITSAGRGVDSFDDPLQALPAAQELAKQYDAVVVVTGALDVITDGFRTWQIEDGHPLMTRVTGIGCALSAVAAACCALPGERLDHVAGACRLIARAGRLTAAWATGPGSFSTGMLDELYRLCGENLQ
ncbi:MAG: hydroxyethylthiazole kinase [Sodalis sp. Psp]|nr:hydroxyethylthiazole kinase [Sodalis sp. Psp]MCR3756581.1 hydroxyethylthiazole kinase [Sodalis sp. Ppy]